MRLFRRLGIAMMGIAGLFGMRTPPEPEVVAQTAPRPESGDNRPNTPPRLVLEREERLQRGGRKQDPEEGAASNEVKE